MEINGSKNKIYSKIRRKTRKNIAASYSYKLLKSFHIFFLFLICTPVPSKNNKWFNENFDSEMNLKIRGSGKQKLFKISGTYQIYLNETQITSEKEDGYTTINIESGEENTIRVLFNNFGGRLDNAFINLSNITEIFI